MAGYNWNPFDRNNNLGWNLDPSPVPSPSTPTTPWTAPIINRPSPAPSTQGTGYLSGDRVPVVQTPLIGRPPYGYTPTPTYNPGRGQSSIPTPNYNDPSGGDGYSGGSGGYSGGRQQQQVQDPRNYMAEAQLQAQVERERIAAENARQAQEIEWYRQQQQADLEAQKQQRLATLASQPKSWLEYASLSGQAPVVQPWMLPLMKGDYGITSAGSPIPNWSATDMTNMPDLIPPSAQYMARIGPTSQQQLYGYEQAVHGATPDESQWRQWSMAPPGSGSYRGLQMQR